MHELSFAADGSAEMVYVGEVPWHKLGHEIKEDEDPAKVRKLAGFAWEAYKCPVQYLHPTLGPRRYEDRFVLTRSDNGLPLGVVGPGYNIVQPSEAFDFFEDLAALGNFKIHTAGMLRGGARFWAMCKVGEGREVVPGDVVEPYIQFSSGLDGVTATDVRFTVVRAVCANTVAMALEGPSSRVYHIAHSVKYDADAARAHLGLVGNAFAEFMLASKRLARKRLKYDDVEALTVDLVTKGYGVKCDEPEEALDTTHARKVLSLFMGDGKGSSMRGVQNTAWGWVNAVTEYVDQHARAQSLDNRLDSSWFGVGDRVKKHALQSALKIAA